MKKSYFTHLFFILFTLIMNSQVGIGTATPNESAVLHITNEGIPNKGVLIAPMTTAQRDGIISPADGLFIYNLTQKCFNYYNSNKWQSLCGEVQPASIINIESCDNVKISGTYIEGRSLTNVNYLELPITVTSEGTLNITAISGNGYSFSYSTSLISVGNHIINLPANGVPAKFGTNPIKITILFPNRFSVKII